MRSPLFSVLTLSIALAFPAAAHAELPEAVIKMIGAAESTGDPKQVAAVHAAALRAYPEEGEALAVLKTDWDKRFAEHEEAEAKRKAEAIRNAGLFERWTGKGELGAMHSTGNSSDAGVTAAIALKRTGIDWRHKLRGQVDYQRSDGQTTRERFLAAYEPNFEIGDSAFVYGLAQAERDRIQGYNARYSLSGGLGYRVFDREGLKLEVKGGPAWRKAYLIDEPDERHLAGLAALDFDWRFAKNLTFTQAASAYVDSGNDTLTSLTGLAAKVNGRLSVRLSYQVEYDTSPPDDAAKTDTLSRMTLVYDF